MIKKIFLMMVLMTLLLSGCHFPSANSTPTPLPTPTPDYGMQIYYGLGMSIYLPPTYVAEDIKTQLPGIIETLTSLLGSKEGGLKDIIDNLEENISWYGYDSGTAAVYPTRLVIIHNKTLAKTPLSLVIYGLERVLRKENVEVDSDTLTLNGRETYRFTYSQAGNAWVAYVFKAEEQLWLSVFITTPANLAVSLGDYDVSVGSMSIAPLPAQ